MADFSVLLKAVLTFILWTSFSFGAHYYARTSIFKYHSRDETTTWPAIIVITMCQMSIGAILLGILTRLPRAVLHRLNITGTNTEYYKGKDKANGHVPHQYTSNTSITTLTVSHLVATLCTNASFVFTSPSSTFIVKAFEPLSTALLSCLLTGKKMETHVIISLPLVVAGCITFTWSKDTTSLSSFGILLAFLSNILFGLRNIALKEESLQNHVAKLSCLATVSLNAAVILNVVIISQVWQAPSLLSVAEFVNGFTPALASAMFHVVYTVISTCLVLRYISVVGHALANLMKRIIVAISFYWIAKTTTTLNWPAGILLIVGLFIYLLPSYTKGKFCENKQHLWLTVMMGLSFLGLVVFQATAPRQLGANITMHEMQQQAHYMGIHPSPLHTGGEMDPYPNMDKADRQFLKKDLAAFPSTADFLSQKLHDQGDVVLEANRIQNMVYSKLLKGKTKAVLVNVFQWVNKGDQFITIGERLLLERFNLSLIYHCYYPGDSCNYDTFPRTSDTVLFLQGAGYIGHPAHLPILTKAMKAFPNNRVIMFPTSVCHPTPPCVNLPDYAKLFKSHSDCHVLLRDHHSYDMAKHYFQKNIYLVPDSAFAVGNIRLNILPSYDIIWIKRKDWETNTEDVMPNIPLGITHQISDWDGNWMKQDGKDFFETHQLNGFSGVLFLTRAHVVITDRLHAHLLSTIMGKANVVIDSRTNKQSHYYMTWEKKLTNSFLARSNEDALKKAMILLRRAKKQH